MYIPDKKTKRIRPVSVTAGERQAALRGYALTLLARREYSSVDLRRKLRYRLAREALNDDGEKRDADEEAEGLVDAVLDELIQRQWLSEDRYIDGVLSSRGHRLSNRALNDVLRQAGVDVPLARERIRLWEQENPESLRAKAEYQRKFGTRSFSGKPADFARRVRYLIQKGFDDHLAQAIVRADCASGEV